MIRKWTAPAIVVVALCAWARPAGAGETRDVSLEHEVERYLDKEVAKTDDATTLRWFWKTGPRFETADGSFKLKFFGRLMFDTFFTTSDAAPDDFDSRDGVLFRRVRLGASGTVYKNTLFKIQLDFASAAKDEDAGKNLVSLKDVYVGLQKLGFVGKVLVGHFKEPFGLEELTSSKYIQFTERSMVAGFAPSRNAGLMASGHAFEKRLNWAVGLFKTTPDSAVTRGDGNYSFTLRVSGILVRNEDHGYLLHGGFSFSFRGDESIRYRFRPGLPTGDRTVDTGTMATDDAVLLGFELGVIWKSLNVTFEAVIADVNLDTGSDPQFIAWYVEVSYWLTGESRAYKSGTYGRTKPKRNFHNASGPGGWQVAFRYDTVDLNDGAIAGGEQDLFSVGVNWHWNPNTRVLFTFVFADVNAGFDDNVSSFITRFQFDF